MRPEYQHENILDRYLMTNKRMGEMVPQINKSVREFMLKEDIEFFDILPDTVTIYRGTSVNEAVGDITDIGQSWTLELKVAEFFAYTYYDYANLQDERCVMKATIQKEFILGYADHRKEKECIVNYLRLQNISYQTRSLADLDEQ